MTNNTLQRYTDKMVDKAVYGAQATDRDELEALLAAVLQEQPELAAEQEAESIALAVAAVDQLLTPEPAESMPPAMADRIVAAVTAEASGSGAGVVDFQSVASQKEQPSRSWSQWLGWYAAAACLALVVYMAVEPPQPTELSLVEQFAALQARSDAQTIAWTTPSAAGYEQVTGEVVWDNTTQTGYMRLTNMPVNDPASSQYQLWIVDPERDQHPVDGGVFDILESGEVIVPIDSKLPIISPAAFAITSEQPGGVVVSAGPLLVVASV